VSSDFFPQLWSAFRAWWREQQRSLGPIGAASLLVRELWGFLRDSTPERRRQRYGDMDYDWEQRVNTTSGAVSWQARLLGVFHSPYQPTEPALFREMMATLPIDFREFTFIDIGSGKGRTLLMASEFPFRRIVGVELIPELNQAAEENVRAYRSGSDRPNSRPSVRPVQIETLCEDARQFVFPETSLVVYLFNPLPKEGLRQVTRNLEQSWQRMPRSIWIVYHNPLLESVLMESAIIVKEAGKSEFSVFRMASAELNEPGNAG
jgi:SAM-dependent methyltransferase